MHFYTKNTVQHIFNVLCKLCVTSRFSPDVIRYIDIFENICKEMSHHLQCYQNQKLGTKKMWGKTTNGTK